VHPRALSRILRGGTAERRPMVDLQQVSSFGGIDADVDDLLDACFEEHEAFLAARDHARFLVLGRKGSGKTAIYRMLVRRRSPDSFSVGHSFDDYPWYHHDRQAVGGVPTEERFVHSWKYLILIALSKILLNQDQSQPWSEEAMESMSVVEQFVVDSYGARDPDVTQIFSPAKTLKLRGSLSVGVSFARAGVNAERLPMESLPLVFQEVNRNLTQAVVESLNPDHDYYVCFDQLDRGFNPGDSNYLDRLVGLMLAARDINHAAMEKGQRLSVLIFLRDDIYQQLRFEDKNKITENSAVRIEWDSEATRHTLQQVMEKRFSVALSIPEQGAWDAVFDTAEMRGRQAKYQHMLDRTFLRPRDMIKFCNEALEAHNLRPRSSERIENVDVNAARKPYSQYLLSELEDEIFKHVTEYESYIELLKSLEALNFDLEEFKRVCAARERSLPDGAEPLDILRQLFEFSMVGYLQSGGAGYGGSVYVWKYKDARARFSEAAMRFRVHPGFTEVLGLKMWTRT
jgi:hypothetical protein